MQLRCNQDELIFLFTDGENNAVKYNILKDTHRTISSSKYIGDILGADVYGLRVGEYFWVLGGRLPNFLIDTTLWSIKREKWIRGPKLPDNLFRKNVIMYEAVCAVSVGSNTAFILRPNTMYSFNFTEKMGRFHNNPSGFSTKDMDFFISCTFHLSKDYQR